MYEQAKSSFGCHGLSLDFFQPTSCHKARHGPLTSPLPTTALPVSFVSLQHLLHFR